MYLLILFLPLLGSISAGFLGRKLGTSGAQFSTIACLGSAAILSLISFYEIAVCDSPVLINLGSWIDSDILTINWLFYFDQLTVTMLVIVSVVSLAVHIYSIYYMKGEPAICFGKTIQWVKLPNSGDLLKLLVPSYIGNNISGWSNYSDMVISQEMIEKEMGYRGSKSVIILFYLILIIFYLLIIFLLYLLIIFLLHLYLHLHLHLHLQLESVDQITILISFSPIITYINADEDKIKILKDNLLKSGIYRWVHKDSGRSYIGSSINLGKRFSTYYSINALIRTNNIISKFLLKYGYFSFSLEILEYCDPLNCLEREQYYLDLLKPELNILKKAGSPLGYKHSEEAIKKISNSLVGNKRSLGRTKPIGSGIPSISLKVFNKETGETKIYSSISEAAKALNVNVGSIRNYFTRNTQTPFKGIFVLEKIKGF